MQKNLPPRAARCRPVRYHRLPDHLGAGFLLGLLSTSCATTSTEPEPSSFKVTSQLETDLPRPGENGRRPVPFQAGSRRMNMSSPATPAQYSRQKNWHTAPQYMDMSPDGQIVIISGPSVQIAGGKLSITAEGAIEVLRTRAGTT